MVLLDLLWSWQKRLGYSLAVAHIHHGLRGKPAQVRFRNTAYLKVKKWADDRKVAFYSNARVSKGRVRLNPSPIGRSSEATMRDFRWKLMRQWHEEFQPDALIVTAHQVEDLLETRLLRLIRGTGASGLKAMSGRDGEIVRPLLSLRKKDLEIYARQHKIGFVEDPSNKDISILRNWLRKKWLPVLEKKSPGAVHAMARSLELILQSFNGKGPGLFPGQAQLDSGEGLDVKTLMKTSIEEKRQIIRNYLKEQGVDHFTHRHIEEILKRLDKIPKQHSFRILGLVWHLDPWRMWASREGTVSDKSSIGLL